jgi:N-acetylglucosamine-6-phosphate deacetylase
MTITGKILGKSGIWEVEIEANEIIKLNEVDKTSSNIWITPGLFDMQVNGYQGINLTDENLKEEDVVFIEKKLLENGITRWCPTIITAAPEVIHKCLETISKAEESGQVQNVHCIHLEGPYLSSEEGYRGIHPLQYIHEPDVEEFNSFQDSANGRIGLVTLAPELRGAIDFIHYLTENSVRVGLGHFNAGNKIINKAVSAGAILSTHLFNGCVSVTDRNRNVIYSQLSQDALWASFIPDEHHVPYTTLKVGLRSKRIDRSIFVSDSISYGGLPDGIYEDEYDRKVIVENEGLWLEGGVYLYGAWRNLMQDVQNIIKREVLDPEKALILSSNNPAKFFGIEEELFIKVGQKGPFLIFNEDSLEYDLID